MFEKELKKYKTRGAFNFKTSDLFKEKCNAPTDQSGVYLIYKIVKGQMILIYIGSSGQKKNDGTLKVRKGGLYDRLVNGYHPNRFGEIQRIKRHKAFPQQMLIEGILEIRVYWWVTYDLNIFDFPTEVETSIRENYHNVFQKLPDWHK